VSRLIKIEVKGEVEFRSMFDRAWHPKLVEVLLWIETRYRVVITEGSRPPRRPGDVHATTPLRAFDLRSWVFDNPEWVANRINRAWVYDPDRPDMNVAVLHDSGEGIHFHIQVHDNTYLKGVI